jgi:hypothetical protein
MSKQIKTLPMPITIVGKGDSMWCNPHQSNKEFEVTGYIFNNFLDGEEPYELQLFGPETEWFHYTDNGIIRGVRLKLLPWIQEQFPDYKIDFVSWSEQGMQPDKGWSFDIICKKKEK